MNRTYRLEAVVLKRNNIGEADKIITVISKQKGKITFIAKGVRRLNSRKAAHLELFSHASLFLSKGKNWDYLTDIKPLDFFSQIRKKMKLVGAAFQLCQLVYCFTPEHQENKEIYFLLVDSLKQINSQGELNSQMLLNFKIKLLDLTGFGQPKNLNLIDDHIASIINKKVKCFYE